MRHHDSGRSIGILALVSFFCGRKISWVRAKGLSPGKPRIFHDFYAACVVGFALDLFSLFERSW